MTAPPRWRCFVAVPLGDALRAAVAKAIDRWRTQPPADRLRWSEPDKLHLTLAFLGDLEPVAVDDIAASLRAAAARHQRVTLATGGLGAFSRSARARVLWYGVADPDGACSAIAHDVSAALALPTDEPYRPHVTLARAPRGPVDLRGWIEPASDEAPKGVLEVSVLQLVRSHLGSGPARYETLATTPLPEAAT